VQRLVNVTWIAVLTCATIAVNLSNLEYLNTVMFIILKPIVVMIQAMSARIAKNAPEARGVQLLWIQIHSVLTVEPVWNSA